jgi:hypothetical protein
MPQVREKVMLRPDASKWQSVDELMSAAILFEQQSRHAPAQSNARFGAQTSQSGGHSHNTSYTHAGHSHGVGGGNNNYRGRTAWGRGPKLNKKQLAPKGGVNKSTPTC